jgi:tripartite-type tricarboxylate transporter receptor subunit TctC
MAVPFLVAVLVSPLLVAAQTYPAKPVRVVVVTPPGLAPDLIGRTVFDKVGDLLGHPFPVENRFGKVGTVGAALVAKSPPDGHTIMVASATLLSTSHIHTDLPYDPLRDFIGVTPLAETVMMLAVHPSLPAKSVAELIALAKKQPGQLAYSSAGNGGATHLTVALLSSMTGVDAERVLYRGSRSAMNALIAGETQFIISGIATLGPQIEAGTLRPLGVTSAKRVTSLPDVPAIAETVPGYEFTSWIAAFVPAGTSAGVVDKLNLELKRALEDRGVASTLAARNLYPMHMTPGQFAQRLKADHEKYGRLIRLTGMKPE